MKHRAYYVRWRDHCTRYGWHDVEADHDALEVETLGWLVKEDKDKVVISPNWTSNDMVSEALTILRGDILELYEVVWK